MPIIKIKCNDCGASSPIDEETGKAVCAYCGAELNPPKRRERVINRKAKLTKKAKAFLIAAAIVIAAVATIIVLVAVSGMGEDEEPLDKRIYKTEGVYLAGTDIPAGEYILYPGAKATTDDPGFYEVRKTSQSAMVVTDIYHKKSFYCRQYVNVEDGQYIYIRNANLYKPASVKLVDISINGYSHAQLKVGADIAPGEYVIMSDTDNVWYFTSVSPVSSASVNPNDPNITSLETSINYRVCLTVTAGEYLYFNTGRIYRPEDEPPIAKTDSGFYRPGHYKVGRDIALKSSYTLESTSPGKGILFAIFTDTTSIRFYGDTRHYELRSDDDTAQTAITLPPDTSEYYIFSTAYFK